MNDVVQIGTLDGSSAVAQRLLQNNMNPEALRTNDVLRKDEWVRMDEVLIPIARRRLVVVQELISRDLVYNIDNGLGTTSLEWEQVTDMDPANVSMSGITEGERDTLNFDLINMPLPIIHKDFSINIRKLEASRRTGQPLDLAQAQMAMTLVAEATEEMVLIGNAIQNGTGRIWGLTNEPQRNTGSLGADWDLPATSGASKLADVLAMMNALQDDNMYGPYGILVSVTAHNNLQDDFKGESDKTQMERLMEVDGVEFIKASKDVPTGTVIMFQLSADVIDEVIGMQPTIVQWDSHGGMTANFKVMSIMIPRVRSTITGQSGVCTFS